MNYETIKKFSSSMRICNAFISITISMFVFIGVATLYNLENKQCNYKDKMNEVLPECF